MWLPYDADRFTIGIGAGGGAFFFDATGLGSDPYVGRNVSSVVGLCSLRARLLARALGLSFLLAVEPGVTLPAIAASDDAGEEIFRFGQPVLLVNAGIGWSR
jgi:hypothetical protein